MKYNLSEETREKKARLIRELQASGKIDMVANAKESSRKRKQNVENLKSEIIRLQEQLDRAVEVIRENGLERML